MKGRVLGLKVRDRDRYRVKGGSRGLRDCSREGLGWGPRRRVLRFQMYCLGLFCVWWRWRGAGGEGRGSFLFVVVTLTNPKTLRQDKDGAHEVRTRRKPSNAMTREEDMHFVVYRFQPHAEVRG